jgi:hypothetical protein
MEDPIKFYINNLEEVDNIVSEAKKGDYFAVVAPNQEAYGIYLFTNVDGDKFNYVQVGDINTLYRKRKPKKTKKLIIKGREQPTKNQYFYHVNKNKDKNKTVRRRRMQKPYRVKSVMLESPFKSRSKIEDKIQESVSSSNDDAHSISSQATVPFDSQATVPFDSQATVPFDSQATIPFDSQATSPFDSQATIPFDSQNYTPYSSREEEEEEPWLSYQSDPNNPIIDIFDYDENENMSPYENYQLSQVKGALFSPTQKQGHALGGSKRRTKRKQRRRRRKQTRRSR